jgi:uncharacterized protein YlzI (FlbEa/FlbD family)
MAAADVIAITKWSIGRNRERPYPISLHETALSKEMNMLRKATTALATVLFFGTPSVLWADANHQMDGSFAQCPMVIVSNCRTAVNEAAKPFTTEERPSFAASQPAIARHNTTARTTAWIKLTEPGGKPIHINVEHVTSVRADTQIPGARAQLDLTSGKFQGVQEDVEQVMQLISTPGAREKDETPSAAL